MIYLGIDPGVTGAVAAIYSNGTVTSVPLPVLKRASLSKTAKDRHYVDPFELHRLLDKYPPMTSVVFLERTQAGMKGAIANYSLGHSSGVIMGVLAALRLNYTEVRPQEWKKMFGLLTAKADRGMEKNAKAKKNKNASREVAQALFPSVSLKRVKDDGRAEALLIAEYGRRIMTAVID